MLLFLGVGIELKLEKEGAGGGDGPVCEVLLCKHEDLSSDPQDQQKPGVARCTWNPSSGRAGTGGSQGLSGITAGFRFRETLSKRTR